MRPAHLLLSVLALATAAAGQEPLPIPAPLLDVLPDLVTQSSWGQDLIAGAEAPGSARRRGVFPLGNGVVFAHCGLGAAANTLQGLTGPGYGNGPAWAPDGDWGSITCELLVGDLPAELPAQRIRRVRGAGFVVTEDARPDGLVLRTLTFAVPARPEILRVMEVWNTGGEPLRGVAFRVRWPGAVEGEVPFLRMQWKSRAPATPAAEVPLAALSLTNGWTFGDGVLGSVEPFDLPPGGSRAATLRFVVLPPGERLEALGPHPALPGETAEAAKAALSWWRARLAETVRVEGDHRPLADLVEDWKVTLLTLRDRGTGAVVPMLHHRRALLRDLGGAVLGFLRLGLFDDARDVLRFEFAAVCRTGRIDAVLELQDPATAPDRPAAGWNALQVPPGDLAPWVVLHHYWYLRATHDTATIRRHWPLLEACVKRMPRPAGELLTEHGTEPWATVGGATFSFGSSFLFAEAIAALGGMQDLIDRVEHPERWRDGAPEPRPGHAFTGRAVQFLQAMEEPFWSEQHSRFSAVLAADTGATAVAIQAELSLLPVWSGWLLATGDRAVRHLQTTLAGLWHRNGLVGSSAAGDRTTPLAQGAALAALTHFEGAEHDAVFQALLDLAAPAGEWSRAHDAAGNPLAAQDPDATVRCGPLEGGVALDALLYAVTGLRVAAAPGIDEEWLRLRVNLPPGARSCSVRGIRHGGDHFDLFLDEVTGPLTAEEAAANAELPEERRRDPAADHRRLRFLVVPARVGDPRGHRLGVVHCMGTQFQEHLRAGETMERTAFWQVGQPMLGAASGR